MALRLKTDYLEGFLTKDEIKAGEAKAKAAFDRVEKDSAEKSQPVGWLRLPVNYDKEEFARIKAAAEKIKSMCDVFIVIGIGGSYLGARAAIEFVKSNNYNLLPKETPDIYFSGNSIDGDALHDLIEICKGKRICVNVISKSGTTTEPAIAFRVFRDILVKQYGEDGAKERIFVTTDKTPKPGTLKEFADLEGYETFVVPDDIGGRYSVLTAVGLLPIAVAGCDIDAMMKGAEKAMIETDSFDIENNDAVKYAVIRNLLHDKGKKSELFVTYVPALQYTAEWWKQLYGESEGKDNKGIYPTSVVYSTDLHSLGQYVQQGERILFETVLNVAKPKHEQLIPETENDVDGIGYIAGKSLHYVNEKAFLGTVYAHIKGGVPNIVMELDATDEENFGYLVYFFERACAISGYILGVNPFDQPGVEMYKKNMFALLGKPGYENHKI
ncbi:MAG: glucose-6-phosphate isomerase [Firmicutes bacterium]|nr:glucose-6-phosphate isomerase [Bacillota bacterium]